MPNQNATQYQTIAGFVITGSVERSTIEGGECFLLANEENRFGVGRRMVDVCDLNGNLIGFVTTGQAELIRAGMV